jgi:hypothetical protein
MVSPRYFAWSLISSPNIFCYASLELLFIDLHPAFKSIIGRMKFSETSITLLVSDFSISGNPLHLSLSRVAFYKTFEHSAIDSKSIWKPRSQHAEIVSFSTLVTAVNQHCLERALASHDVESDSVERLLLSLIFHCSKDGDHARAMKDVDSAFKCM